MVTILNRRQHGYDVVIYTKDHSPAHAHVIKGERRLRINLPDMTVSRNRGFNSREIKRIRRLLNDNLDFIMSEWARIDAQR